MLGLLIVGAAPEEEQHYRNAPEGPHDVHHTRTAASLAAPRRPYYTDPAVTDDDLVRAFEDCSLESFHHRDHVLVTWTYLRRGSVLETLQRLVPALKRFAESKGLTNLYHETITWAYTVLINERMQRMDPDHDFAQFLEHNPDLLDWKNSVLSRYYDQETLKSDFARRVFVLPDPRRADRER